MEQQVRKGIKKGDVILIAGIAAVAVALGLCFMAADERMQKAVPDGGGVLIITVDGQTAGTYPLDQDRIIEIGTTNVCEIKNKEAYMQSADCPDHICMRSDPISEAGESIVCLPNRVVLKVAASPDQPSDRAVDAVAY